MNKDRLLTLMDEEARHRRHIRSLIKAKKRLINIIGDEDICTALIEVITALNEAVRKHDAVYTELMETIKKEKENESENE